MPDETVPTHLVQRLLRNAERQGLDVGVLLRSARIPDDVAYNGRARVTLNQLSDLTRGIWAATDDELFGVGPRVPLGSFRLIAPSIFAAPDLRTMLIRMDQATRVLTNLPRIEERLDSDTPCLTVDVSRLADPEHIVIDTLIAFIHRTVGWAIGRPGPRPSSRGNVRPPFRTVSSHLTLIEFSRVGEEHAAHAGDDSESYHERSFTPVLRGPFGRPARAFPIWIGREIAGQPW